MIPNGKSPNINGFDAKADSKFKCNISMSAVVSPHPGHLNPNRLLHKQGMHISRFQNDFIKTETTRYPATKLITLLVPK